MAKQTDKAQMFEKQVQDWANRLQQVVDEMDEYQRAHVRSDEHPYSTLIDSAGYQIASAIDSIKQITGVIPTLTHSDR